MSFDLSGDPECPGSSQASWNAVRSHKNCRCRLHSRSSTTFTSTAVLSRLFFFCLACPLYFLCPLYFCFFCVVVCRFCLLLGTRLGHPVISGTGFFWTFGGRVLFCFYHGRRVVMAHAVLDQICQSAAKIFTFLRLVSVPVCPVSNEVGGNWCVDPGEGYS